ncbi:MAG: hypothetical protein LBP87_06685 [Planctomycetaceae bacterium]|jgi:hypothetical protein|nr:hypothetical protein [Planctomycetaceae bacterium]
MQSITVLPMLDAIDRGDRNILVPDISPVIHNTGQNSTSGIFARSRSGQFAKHPLGQFGLPYEIEKEQSDD